MLTLQAIVVRAALTALLFGVPLLPIVDHHALARNPAAIGHAHSHLSAAVARYITHHHARPATPTHASDEEAWAPLAGAGLTGIPTLGAVLEPTEIGRKVARVVPRSIRPAAASIARGAEPRPPPLPPPIGLA